MDNEIEQVNIFDEIEQDDADDLLGLEKVVDSKLYLLVRTKLDETNKDEEINKTNLCLNHSIMLINKIMQDNSNLLKENFELSERIKKLEIRVHKHIVGQFERCPHTSR